MQREISSCSTDSMNIMSRSLTMAPLITMISSPLMIPAEREKGLVGNLQWISDKGVSLSTDPSVET